jgi:hypothetical protein
MFRQLWNLLFSDEKYITYFDIMEEVRSQREQMRHQERKNDVAFELTTIQMSYKPFVQQ